MKNLNWLVILCLSFLLLTGIAPQQVQAQQERYKPDVHLSFDIRADGANETRLEVAVHPFLDPLTNELLEKLAERIAENPGRPKTEVGVSKRAGRQYSALSVELNSIGDLNALMNTSQMLSGVLSLVAPGTELPGMFAEFVVMASDEPANKAVSLSAHMTPETTQALSFFNLTIHVTLPYAIVEHNADQVHAAELSWYVIPGEELEILAEAAVVEPTPVPTFTPLPKSAPVPTPMSGRPGGSPGDGIPIGWLVFGGIALLVGAGVIAFLLVRSKQPKTTPSEQDWWDITDLSQLG